MRRRTNADLAYFRRMREESCMALLHPRRAGWRPALVSLVAIPLLALILAMTRYRAHTLARRLPTGPWWDAADEGLGELADRRWSSGPGYY